MWRIQTEILQKIFIVMLLLLSGFLVVYPNIPKVHAVTLNNTCSHVLASTNSNTCALTTTSGDIIIFFVALWMNAASCPPSYSATFPKLSGGESLTLISNTGCKNSGSSFGGDQIYSYYATSTTTGTDTFTATFASNANRINLWGFDTSGGSTALIQETDNTQTITASTGSYTTTSSLSYSSNTILIGASTAGIIGGQSAGSGFTGLTQTTASCDVAMAEYQTVSSSGSTNFPANWNGNVGGCITGEPFYQMGVTIGTSLSSSPTFKCQLKNAAAPPTETVALSGGSVSPVTALCSSAGSTTALTCTPSAIITITVFADAQNTRYRFNDSSTSKTFACNTATFTFYNYFEVSNSYAVQALSPPYFNIGGATLTVSGTLGGSASTTTITIPSVQIHQVSTASAVYFDYGTVTLPSSFTIAPATWNASPVGAANIANTNNGGATLIVGYTTGTVSTTATAIVTTVIVTTTVLTNSNTPCVDTNSCLLNQFSAFMVVLFPTLLITGLFEYIAYLMGARDGRIFIFIFMMGLTTCAFLSSVGAFGIYGIPWYIAIFVDIMGFMLLISYKSDSEFKT